LKRLAERRAFGLVEEVILIGSPIPSDSHHWVTMRSVVSGNVTNVYSENDYILAFLYRATSIQLGIAGLQKIDGVEGVSNLDLSEEVSGHLRYPELIGKILRKAGMEGILVSDEIIEGDLHEIQLVEGNKNKQVSGGAMNDLLGLDMGSLSISDSSKDDDQKRKSISKQPDLYGDMDIHNTPLWPPFDVRGLTDDFSGLGIQNSSPQPSRAYQASSSVSISAQTQIQQGEPSSPQHPDPNVLFEHPDAESDSDDGGIQMEDNDMEELECEPISDDWQPFDEGKVAVESGSRGGRVDDQKFLGSFPRDQQARIEPGNKH